MKNLKAYKTTQKLRLTCKRIKALDQILRVQRQKKMWYACKCIEMCNMCKAFAL